MHLRFSRFPISSLKTNKNIQALLFICHTSMSSFTSLFHPWWQEAFNFLPIPFFKLKPYSILFIFLNISQHLSFKNYGYLYVLRWNKPKRPAELYWVDISFLGVKDLTQLLVSVILTGMDLKLLTRSWTSNHSNLDSSSQNYWKLDVVSWWNTRDVMLTEIWVARLRPENDGIQKLMPTAHIPLAPLLVFIPFVLELSQVHCCWILNFP